MDATETAPAPGRRRGEMDRLKQWAVSALLLVGGGVGGSAAAAAPSDIDGAGSATLATVAGLAISAAVDFARRYVRAWWRSHKAELQRRAAHDERLLKVLERLDARLERWETPPA